MDRDGDGNLNMDEFTKGGGDGGLNGQREDFPDLDKNGDGSLDVKELQAYFSGRHVTEKDLFEFIDQADKDENGHVTLKEMLARRKHLKAAGSSEASYHFTRWMHELEL